MTTATERRKGPDTSAKPVKPTQQVRPSVLFINRSYWPDVEATGQLLTELCEDLATEFDVRVLVGQPHHNPSQANFRRRGAAKRRGVSIRRVRHFRLPKTRFAFRVVNHLSFFLSAWITAFFIRRPDIIVVKTDPPLLCLLGAALKRWRGSKLVVYLQDIYPDVAIELGWLRRNWRTRLLRKWMFRSFNAGDRIVVVGRDMEKFLQREKLGDGRTVCIPNWIDTSASPIKTNNPFRQAHDLEGRFVVMYSGNMGLCHQLEDIVKAAEQLRRRDDIRFVFVGGGVMKPRLQQRCTDLELTNVLFLPYQPKEELASSLSAADLHLVTIDPRVVSYLMPSKLYGALASSTPILTVAPKDSELAQVVEHEQVGLVASPGDAEQIAEHIRWGADHREELRSMGAAARELAQRRYDRRHSVGSFAVMLSELIAQSPKKSKPTDSSASKLSSEREIS